MALENQEAIPGALKNPPAVEAVKQEAAASPLQPCGQPPSASETFVAPKKGSLQAPPANTSAPDYPKPASDEPQAWIPRAVRRS